MLFYSFRFVIPFLLQLEFTFEYLIKYVFYFFPPTGLPSSLNAIYSMIKFLPLLWNSTFTIVEIPCMFRLFFFFFTIPLIHVGILALALCYYNRFWYLYDRAWLIILKILLIISYYSKHILEFVKLHPDP